MYLLDTNILIYLMKGTFPALNEMAMTVHPSQMAVSAVSILELEYGASKSRWGERTRQTLRIFLSEFQIIPFTEADAVAAGRIRAELAQRGILIGAYDLQIAAQGVARGLTVVTHNTGEFQRVPGLSVEDWTE